jgi:hypothetical protein
MRLRKRKKEREKERMRTEREIGTETEGETKRDNWDNEKGDKKSGRERKKWKIDIQ